MNISTHGNLNKDSRLTGYSTIVHEQLPVLKPWHRRIGVFPVLLKIIRRASVLLYFLAFAAHAEVSGVISGKQLQAEAETRVSTISTEELSKTIENNPDLVLVDIRTPSEINTMGGAIKAPQNINIPRGWLEHRITGFALSKDTPIVVYCGAGIRTPLAADTLQKMGYSDVRDYSDGFIGWKKAGLPVAK